MKRLLTIGLLFFLFMNSNHLFAQYTFFTPPGSFAIEVSLENSDLKRLPIYRNAISSLIVSGDNIIGGTSADKGLAPFIFIASLNSRKMVQIKDVNEVIKGQQSIRSGFSRGKNNSFFAGTLANDKSDGAPGDGHLIQLEIKNGGNIIIKDLGIPIPGEGILSIVSDRSGELLFGISYPSGTFFRYNVKTKEYKIYTDLKISKSDLDMLDEFRLEPLDYLPKRLIESNGLVYGSMPLNKIFYFDIKNETFKMIGDIPEVWGRKALGRIESWAVSPSGKIYGGNSGDGQLIEIDPVTKKIKNLGKPISMTGLSGLCFGKNSKLYGIAGGQPGYSHLFSYDVMNGFVDYGNPEFKMVAPGIEQGILWRGFQLGTIAASENGSFIVMGENEALSQLLIFPVNK